MVNRAEIGRFDGVLSPVVFNEGDTIQSLLDKANLSLGKGEGVNNESGDDVAVGSVAEDGEVYYIVGNYKQGAY